MVYSSKKSVKKARSRSRAASGTGQAKAAPAVRAPTPEEAFEAQERRRLRGLGHGAEEARRGAELGFWSLSPARRVSGRDGLAWLFDKGRLTGVEPGPGGAVRASPTQHMRAQVRLFALLRYRGLYEAAQAGLGSALAPEKVNGGGSGSATSDRYVAAWARAGQVGVLLGACDRGVLHGWPRGRELEALRRIAGAGETARGMARSGAEERRVVLALIRAADVVAALLRAPGAEALAFDRAGERAVAAGRALLAPVRREVLVRAG